jgi:N-terminal domain of anti-restriction factor ArdC
VRVPMNYASKKPYRGVNTFLLAVSRFKAGYDSNYWLTFRQIQALGLSEPIESFSVSQALRKRSSGFTRPGLKP